METVLSRNEFQKLLEEVAQYSDEQYQKFLKDLERLRRRKQPNEEEAELIRAIKEGGPGKQKQLRFTQLSHLAGERSLTSAEQEEYDALLLDFGDWSIDRTRKVARLASLRKQPIPVVARALDLHKTAFVNG